MKRKQYSERKLNTYIKKEESSQINNLSFHLKKQEQTKTKGSRRKEIINTNIKEKTNEM